MSIVKVAAPKLVSYEQARPSTYNPRQADPLRLQLLELSLRKLGFLLPLYADKSGELLSGHQRHHVSGLIGLTHVPLSRFNIDLPLNERKALNILFNRGTNDMDITDTSQSVTKALQSADVFALAQQLPDLTPNSPEFYPCMSPQKMDIKPMLSANTGRWIQYASNMASAMHQKGIMMPLIATPDLKIVNGIGRLQLLAEKEVQQVEVVFISEIQARFAHAMLNWLSMDFDIKGRYADYLRHNSFRRAATASSNQMGYGFTFAAHPQKPANTFHLDNIANFKAFERQHGSKILDFGAGRLKEVTVLRGYGLEADAFEPYHIPPNEGDTINKKASIALNRRFLEAVASGKQWTSIFNSAVLNSVPFYEDRVHVVRILAALCNQGCKVYASANANTQSGYKRYLGSGSQNRQDAKSQGFNPTYEEGVAIASLTTGAPKAQKFHSLKEFHDLFKLFFEDVRADYFGGGVVTTISWNPKPIVPAELKASLEFEFDLPYPDESRMGLGDEAKAAFAQRLNISFDDKGDD